MARFISPSTACSRPDRQLLELGYSFPVAAPITDFVKLIISNKRSLRATNLHTSFVYQRDLFSNLTKFIILNNKFENVTNTSLETEMLKAFELLNSVHSLQLGVADNAAKGLTIISDSHSYYCPICNVLHKHANTDASLVERHVLTCWQKKVQNALSGACPYCAAQVQLTNTQHFHQYTYGHYNNIASSITIDENNRLHMNQSFANHLVILHNHLFLLNAMLFHNYILGIDPFVGVCQLYYHQKNHAYRDAFNISTILDVINNLANHSSQSVIPCDECLGELCDASPVSIGELISSIACSDRVRCLCGDDGAIPLTQNVRDRINMIKRYSPNDAVSISEGQTVVLQKKQKPASVSSAKSKLSENLRTQLAFSKLNSFHSATKYEEMRAKFGEDLYQIAFSSLGGDPIKYGIFLSEAIPKLGIAFSMRILHSNTPGGTYKDMIALYHVLSWEITFSTQYFSVARYKELLLSAAAKDTLIYANTSLVDLDGFGESFGKIFTEDPLEVYRDFYRDHFETINPSDSTIADDITPDRSTTDADSLYTILNIPSNAKSSVINSIAKTIRLRCHPDRVSNTFIANYKPTEGGAEDLRQTDEYKEAMELADRSFKKINEAITILKDPALRSHYDQYGLDSVRRKIQEVANHATSTANSSSDRME